MPSDKELTSKEQKKIPARLEKEMATYASVFLPEKSHGQRNMGVTVHGVIKELDRTDETTTTTTQTNASVSPTLSSTH